jgi:6-phosphogluconolactonase
MQNFELLSFANADELARAAASAWLDEIETAQRVGNPHCVALSGGRITQKFFTATVEQARPRNVSFANVHFFWADERCVQPDDPESNFKLAIELLFAPLNIAAKKVHRLHGEDLPATAVKNAEAELRRVVTATKNNLPSLDLILLGMGEDGHVASLFPNATAATLSCSAPFLSVDNSPKPPRSRISLSYAAIAAAQNVWTLVSGAGKETAFRESIRPDGQTPLARVMRARSGVKVFSDISAA